MNERGQDHADNDEAMHNSTPACVGRYRRGLGPKLEAVLERQREGHRQGQGEGRYKAACQQAIQPH